MSMRHNRTPRSISTAGTIRLAQQTRQVQRNTLRTATTLIALLALAPRALSAQDHQHHSTPPDSTQAGRVSRLDGRHPMWVRSIGGGWSAMGMAQVFPVMTAGSAGRRDGVMRDAGVYATQPVAMINLSSSSQRIVVRTTLDAEALTQKDGEITYGGWGEGFIDARHPHTVVHEAIVTVNLGRASGTYLSVSAGKGFAPYGTDDPMGRPAVKYPTNHHLSQVLERFTTNLVLTRNGWGVEAGIFGGAEPTSANDFSNISSYGDSWSTRLSKRSGGDGPSAAWEVSSSFARIADAHHGRRQYTNLFNTAFRHVGRVTGGSLYMLLEGSRSRPATGRGHSSVLGESQLTLGAAKQHQPYLRVEYATRPEYDRLGEPGTPAFFRYAHGAHERGATRWLITTIGYGYESRQLPTSVRPFVEVQHHAVRSDRSAIDPHLLYGNSRVWSITTGVRVFLGGGAMRMGSYGQLDPMTAANHKGAH